MEDATGFFAIGIIVGNPEWIQGKMGQTLQLTMQVTRRGANGGTIQDLLQVRFRRDPNKAAQNLSPGTPVCVAGTIGGREYNGKVYTNLNAESYTILAAPQPYDPNAFVVAPPPAPGYPPPPAMVQQSLPPMGYAQTQKATPPPPPPPPKQPEITDEDIPLF